MATLRQIVYDVLNTLNSGRVDNNPRPNEEFIKYKINYYRAIMARRYLIGRAEYRHFEQNFGEIPIEPYFDNQILSHEFFLNDLRSKNFCTIYKGTIALPSRIRIKEKPELSQGITYIGTSSTINNVQLVDEHAIQYAFLGKYSGNEPRAFISDSTLYYIVPNKIKYKERERVLKETNFEPNINIELNETPEILYVKGIFENPLDVTGITENSQYPIPSDLLRDLVMFVVSDLIGTPKPIMKTDEA